MKTIDPRDRRELSMALAGDLRANRILLTKLAEYHEIFRFMGGIIPPMPLCFDVMTAYRKCPSEESGIPTATVDRYRILARAIADLDRATFSQPSPRSLRNRKEIADQFDCASAEIREAGTAMESALSNVGEKPKPSLPRS
jgi:hypothetical protein